MDLTNYSEIIRKTMEEVAFGNPDSVASKAEAQLKEFLETNTSIPDDKKAQVYANFLQQIVTTTINQAISAALTLPVNQKQIEVMERETAVKEALKDSDIAVNAQKIASMQAEDEARKNEVAAKVAKAKVEIEQLIPSQIALNKKQLEVEAERVEAMKAETEVKRAQIAEMDKKLKIMDAELEVEKAKARVEEQRVDIMRAEVEISREKIPLIKAQAQVEEKRVDLIDAQTKIEEKRLPLLEKQVDAEQAKIDFTRTQIDVEKEKLEFERDKAWYDSVYKRAQAETMQKSITTNERIEKCKCDTQLKVAQIKAESL